VKRHYELRGAKEGRLCGLDGGGGAELYARSLVDRVGGMFTGTRSSNVAKYAFEWPVEGSSNLQGCVNIPKICEDITKDPWPQQLCAADPHLGNCTPYRQWKESALSKWKASQKTSIPTFYINLLSMKDR
jgi:hypothetical protein